MAIPEQTNNSANICLLLKVTRPEFTQALTRFHIIDIIFMVEKEVRRRADPSSHDILCMNVKSKLHREAFFRLSMRGKDRRLYESVVCRCTLLRTPLI